MRLDEVDEGLESRRNLPSTGIIEIETYRARRPIFQQRYEPLLADVSFDPAERQAGYAYAVQRRAEREVAIADDERAFDQDLHALSALFERPGLHGAARKAHADAIV